MARTPQHQLDGEEDGAMVVAPPRYDARRREDLPPVTKPAGPTVRSAVASVTLSTLLLVAFVSCSLTHTGLAATFFVLNCVVRLAQMMLIAAASFAAVAKMISSLRPNPANDPSLSSADAAALRFQRLCGWCETMASITVCVILVCAINAAFVDTSNQAAKYADGGKERALAAIDYVKCLRLDSCQSAAAEARQDEPVRVRDIVVASSSEAIYVATNPDGSACRGALNSTNDVIHYTHCLLRDVGATETMERINFCACKKSLRSLQLCILGSTLDTLALKERAVTKIASCAL